MWTICISVYYRVFSLQFLSGRFAIGDPDKSERFARLMDVCVEPLCSGDSWEHYVSAALHEGFAKHDSIIFRGNTRTFWRAGNHICLR